MITADLGWIPGNMVLFLALPENMNQLSGASYEFFPPDTRTEKSDARYWQGRMLPCAIPHLRMVPEFQHNATAPRRRHALRDQKKAGANPCLHQVKGGRVGGRHAPPLSVMKHNSDSWHRLRCDGKRQISSSIVEIAIADEDVRESISVLRKEVVCL